MPYRTERGVTSFSDHDTPPEYASDADEERAMYNEAHDEAFQAAEELCGLIDNFYEPPAKATAADMQKLRNQIVALVAETRALANA